jgi:hypothetical protein
MRLSASLVAISLDSDVTVGTLAAYPRLFPAKAGSRKMRETRRTNAHLLFCLTPRGVFLAGYIAIAYGSLLHYLFTFTPCSCFRKKTQGEVYFLWHFPSAEYYGGLCITERAVLRSPDFPPAKELWRATTFYLPPLTGLPRFSKK